MRYRDHDAGKRIQIVLKDGHSRNVQIISRLIQKEHIGSFHQDFQKVQSSLLPSGKLLNRSILHSRVKKESLKHLGCSDPSLFRWNILCYLADVVDHALSSVHIWNILGKISNADGLTDLDLTGIRSHHSFYHLK